MNLYCIVYYIYIYKYIYIVYIGIQSSDSKIEEYEGLKQRGSSVKRGIKSILPPTGPAPITGRAHKHKQKIIIKKEDYFHLPLFLRPGDGLDNLVNKRGVPRSELVLLAKRLQEKAGKAQLTRVQLMRDLSCYEHNFTLHYELESKIKELYTELHSNIQIFKINNAKHKQSLVNSQLHNLKDKIRELDEDWSCLMRFKSHEATQSNTLGNTSTLGNTRVIIGGLAPPLQLNSIHTYRSSSIRKSSQVSAMFRKKSDCLLEETSIEDLVPLFECSHYMNLSGLSCICKILNYQWKQKYIFNMSTLHTSYTIILKATAEVPDIEHPKDLIDPHLSSFYLGTDKGKLCLKQIENKETKFISFILEGNKVEKMWGYERISVLVLQKGFNKITQNYSYHILLGEQSISPINEIHSDLEEFKDEEGNLRNTKTNIHYYDIGIISHLPLTSMPKYLRSHLRLSAAPSPLSLNIH